MTDILNYELIKKMRLARSLTRWFRHINLRPTKSYKYSTVKPMDKDLDDKYDTGATVKALTTKVAIEIMAGIEEAD